MSKVISAEITLFAASFIVGAILIWAYGILVLFRKIVKHRGWAVNLEDLIYWLLASFVIFGVMFEKNNGALRGYAFWGILAGAWIQWNLISFFREIYIKVLKKFRKRGKMA